MQLGGKKYWLEGCLIALSSFQGYILAYVYIYTTPQGTSTLKIAGIADVCAIRSENSPFVHFLSFWWIFSILKALYVQVYKWLPIPTNNSKLLQGHANTTNACSSGTGYQLVFFINIYYYSCLSLNKDLSVNNKQFSIIHPAGYKSITINNSNSGTSTISTTDYDDYDLKHV